MGALRELRARGGDGVTDVIGETWNVPGVFIYLQSVVVLTVSWRLLFFFRGNLRLGALTHTFGRICVDIVPLMAFLFVFIFGFTASMMILIMHELDEEYFSQVQSYHLTVLQSY